MGRSRRRKKARLMYIRFALFIILIIIAISLIKNTVARYRSSATSAANVDLAFYLFHEESISQSLKLESILPKVGTYDYDFLVANNDGENRTETAIEYSIEIVCTTNLPLNYRVYDKSNPTVNLVTTDQTTQDDNGTYFRHIHVTGGNLGFQQDEEVEYELSIEFPERFHVASYEGIIEYLEIIVRSHQKISVATS